MISAYTSRPSLIAATGPRTAATELFIVEGESAANSVASIRDETTQAVLGLQGKPVNAIKATATRIQANPLFQLLDEAIGLKATSEGRGFPKVILLFDPDADGIHCATLLLGYLIRFQTHLLDNNSIYLARPPEAEFQVLTKPGGKSQTFYGYPNGATPKLRRDLKAANFHSVKQLVFRGLASIPPATLVRTCINPKTRSLIPINKSDARRAIEIFGG